MDQRPQRDLQASLNEEYDLEKALDEQLRYTSDPVEIGRLQRDLRTSQGRKQHILLELGRIKRMLSGTVWGLVEDVQTYLTLLDWKIFEGLEEPYLGEIEFRIEKPEGLLFRRELIHLTAEEADLTSLRRLQQGMDDAHIPLGWLIAEKRLSPELTDSVGRSSNITVSTVGDLLLSLASMDVDWLRREYRRRWIGDFFIDLSCLKIGIDENRTLRETRHASLTQYIDDWRKGRGQSHVSILGDFGTGKTWFAWHYAQEQLQRFLDNPVQERFPLILSLHDYKKDTNIEQFLGDFAQRYGTRLTSGRIFDMLNSMGKLLIILDGFDEMSRGIEGGTPATNFLELARLVVPNSKVILTSRTAYFRDGLDEFLVLSTRNVEGPKPEAEYVVGISGRPSYEIVHMEPLSQDQIIAFLRKRVPDKWESFWRQIKMTFDLPNLAQRPILLQMISETLALIQDLPEVNSFILYETYTDNWMQKNIDEGRASTDKPSLRSLMQELAWEMYDRGMSQIRSSDMSDKTRRYLADVDEGEVTLFDADVRAQSLLVRDGDGNYFFAHRSFMEFFVASKMVELIRLGDKSCLSAQRPTNQVCSFLAHSGVDEDVELLDRLIEWAGTGIENKDCRWNITYLFTFLRSPMLVSVILKDLPRIWHNAEIIWSLGERELREPSLHDDRVVEFLRNRIKDSSNVEPWWNAAFALKSITKSDPLSSLTENFNDPKWTVDHALNNFEDKRAIIAILSAVRNGVLDANRASSVIVAMWPKLKLTWSSEYNALWTFGALKSPVAIPVLKEEAHHPDFAIRNRIAEAFGEIGSPEGIAPLVDLLRNDREYRVRRYAAESLGKIGDPRALADMREALEDEQDPNVRSMIEWAIKRIKLI